MASSYEETSVDDLRYYLVEGELDSDLNVVCSDTIQNDTLALTARIIGSSHHLTIQSGDTLYQEVVACTELQQQEACYAGEADVEFGLELDCMRYEFDSTVCSSVQAENWWTLDDPDLNLRHAFPGKEHFKTEPVTQIKAKLDDGLVYETLHNYPNERQAFLTRTNFTILTLREAIL